MAQSRFTYVPATYQDWTQHPDYVQACRTIPRAGDPTVYTPPHPPGASPTDSTSFQVGMAQWSEDNLPSIMYQLWPCGTWRAFKNSARPHQKRDAQGHFMYERYPRPGQTPRPLLDYPILRDVDQISTTVPWWFVEILFRLEPRLEWNDIDMRMEYVGKRLKQPAQSKFVNARNNACRNGRMAFKMVSWREKSKNSTSNIARDTVLAELSNAQKTANTTRGSTPGLDLQGNRVPVPTNGGPGGANGANAQTQLSTTTSTQLSASTSNPTAGSSQGSRQAAPSVTGARSSEDEKGYDDDGDADNNDDDEDNPDIGETSQTAPRQKRKRRASEECSLEEESEYSNMAEYEPGASENTERPLAADVAGPQTKKRKGLATSYQNEMGPLLQRPHPPATCNSAQTSISNRGRRSVHEVRNHRLNRIPPHSTSSINVTRSTPTAYQIDCANTQLASNRQPGPFNLDRASYGNASFPSDVYGDRYVPSHLAYNNTPSSYRTYPETCGLNQRGHDGSTYLDNILENTLTSNLSAAEGVSNSNDTFPHDLELNQSGYSGTEEVHAISETVIGELSGNIGNVQGVNLLPLTAAPCVVGNVFEHHNHIQSTIDRTPFNYIQPGRQVVTEAEEHQCLGDSVDQNRQTQARALQQSTFEMANPRHRGPRADFQASQDDVAQEETSHHLAMPRGSNELWDNEVSHGGYNLNNRVDCDNINNTSALLANAQRPYHVRRSADSARRLTPEIAQPSQHVSQETEQQRQASLASSTSRGTVTGAPTSNTLAQSMVPVRGRQTLQAPSAAHQPGVNGQSSVQQISQASSTSIPRPQNPVHQLQQVSQDPHTSETTNARATQFAEDDDVFAQFTTLSPGAAQDDVEAGGESQEQEQCAWSSAPASWNSAWSQFIDLHDPKALLEIEGFR